MLQGTSSKGGWQGSSFWKLQQTVDLEELGDRELSGLVWPVRDQLLTIRLQRASTDWINRLIDRLGDQLFSEHSR